jgi:hypothetical protein
MKKTRYNLLSATLCVAELSLCMFSVAKGENTVSPSILLGDAPGAELSAQPFNGNSYQYNNLSDPVGSAPASSFTPIGSDPQNVVIPEPTTAACTLLGLGVLASFRYLKNGRRI